MDLLPHEASVVVIGGGIMGASIAFHLAEAGVADVVLLERDGLAGGSSGKPIGGVRAQFSDVLNVRLAARSLAAWHAFGARPGADIGLERVGYLFLLRTPEAVAQFERSHAIQAEHGVRAQLLSPAEAHARNPWLDPGTFLAAAFTPEDGHARPVVAAAAYVEAARRRGARAVTGCEVAGIEVREGEIAAVRTSQGTVRTSTVVCAAGPWSAQIGAMAGVELDVRPVRRQLAFSEPLEGRTAGLPFTIDFDSTFYFHGADDGAVLLGISDPDQAPGYERDFTEDWLPALRRAAARCAPELADVRVAGGWAGLYEMTPDHNALIGESPSVGRFLYATGFSGHGFCQAPATAEVIRDLVLGVEPFVDVTPLRAERFAERAPVLEANIV